MFVIGGRAALGADGWWRIVMNVCNKERTQRTVFFGEVVRRCCMRMKKVELVDSYLVLWEFFKDAFDYSGSYYAKHGKDVSNVDEMEDAVVGAMQEFAVKLTQD